MADEPTAEPTDEAPLTTDTEDFESNVDRLTEHVANLLALASERVDSSDEYWSRMASVAVRPVIYELLLQHDVMYRGLAEIVGKLNGALDLRRRRREHTVHGQLEDPGDDDYGDDTPWYIQVDGPDDATRDVHETTEYRDVVNLDWSRDGWLLGVELFAEGRATPPPVSAADLQARIGELIDVATDPGGRLHPDHDESTSDGDREVS